MAQKENAAGRPTITELIKLRNECNSDGVLATTPLTTTLGKNKKIVLEKYQSDKEAWRSCKDSINKKIRKLNQANKIKNLFKLFLFIIFNWSLVFKEKTNFEIRIVLKINFSTKI